MRPVGYGGVEEIEANQPGEHAEKQGMFQDPMEACNPPLEEPCGKDLPLLALPGVPFCVCFAALRVGQVKVSQ